VLELRLAWHSQDFPDLETPDYIANAREVAMTRDVQVIATSAGEELVGFTQVERSGSGAEITQVYVHPAHRGSGRGTALTRAAIEAAGDVDDLWIVADDEGRPKQLYARLGFRPAWTSIEFVRAPGIAGYSG
jgi:GNAT superfamily N-acetyltransferase